ncbi:histone deacetylase family protein [Hutsoniella sourekii]
MSDKKRLGIVFFPAFDWAISPTHPEREERLLYTQDQLREEGIEDIDSIGFYRHEMASPLDIERVHIVAPSVDQVVTDSHLVSIGATIKAFELYQSQEVEKAFALVRPPGHHAFKTVFGDRGFCIANIEAVALEHIRQGNKKLRVAIVDTDCHHGDGTQDIYWNDPDTLFISIHQDGRTLFPGTGFVEEAGGPAAYGLTVNVPLPPGTGEQGFQQVMDQVVIPILEDFQPDIVINSAGQDNHYSDPLTNMNFTAQGYGHLTDQLDPDIVVLEGGYSIESALPYVNLALVLALAGLDYSQVVEPDFQASKTTQSAEITHYIDQLCQQIRSHWQNRQAIAEAKFQGLEAVSYKQQIYYDTDGILAQEEKVFHRCPDCPGLETIESRTDTGLHIYAYCLHRRACPACLEKAYQEYQEQTGPYTHIYLQDRVNDVYKHRLA